MTSANKSLEKNHFLCDFLLWDFTVKLNMESCEPADEEELPTFSLGVEFLTPQKERKEDKILDKRILYSIRK